MEPAARLSLPRERHTVRVARLLLEDSLVRAGFDPLQASDLSIALSEACSNAVRHASGAPSYDVEIAIDDDGTCTVVVADEGSGFEHEAISMPDPDAQGGRGLALIDALVDEYRIDALPGAGSRITMQKHLDHG